MLDIDPAILDRLRRYYAAKDEYDAAVSVPGWRASDARTFQSRCRAIFGGPSHWKNRLEEDLEAFARAVLAAHAGPETIHKGGSE